MTQIWNSVVSRRVVMTLGVCVWGGGGGGGAATLADYGTNSLLKNA